MRSHRLASKRIITPPGLFRALTICFISVLGLAGCRAGQDQGETTLVWLSIDGFRGDYLARVRPPNISRMAQEGAYTTQLVPVYPSKTFPNHISLVTGVTPDRHGIVANVFYDRSRKQRFGMSDDSSLLRAEPIWITAKRQGLRVFVTDWPVSQQQTGPIRIDFTPGSFDRNRTSAQRLHDTIDRLNADTHPDAPRLVMSYVGEVDSTGHRYGPESPQVDQALLDADRIVGEFQAELIKWFEARRGPHDELCLLITTDHGMATVHTMVSLDRLLGADLLKDVRSIDSGTIALLYLDDLPEAARAARADAIVEKLQNVPYLKAWRQGDVPRELHFSDADRVGDVVVSLNPGFCFSPARFSATMPVGAGPLGMHGYSADQCPEMLGTAILWKYRKPIGGKDLGRVSATQFHATAAGLLQIQPAAGAAPPVNLDVTAGP